MWRLVLALTIGACGGGSRPTEPAKATVVEPEVGSASAAGCRTLDIDSLDLATIGSGKTAQAILEWIETHPEEARRLGKSLKVALEERLAELRAQLERMERSMEARCAGAIEASAVFTGRAGKAAIEGRLLLPTGRLPLAAARVELVSASGAAVGSVQASGCGRFRFQGLAAGSYRLRFAARSFGGEAEVVLAAGVERRDFRVATTGQRIAVVSGHYDAVEVILAGLGIPYDRLSAACLGDSMLASYRIVFVNCRHPGELPAATVDNLRRQVTGGGSIYFSDLTLPYVEQAWPDRGEPSPEKGRSETRSTRVADPELRAFLGGRDEVEVRFNLAGWRRLARAEPTMRVLLSDRAAPDRPTMVLFDVDQGRVGYTSFHYTAQPLDDMVFSLIFFLTRL